VVIRRLDARAATGVVVDPIAQSYAPIYEYWLSIDRVVPRLLLGIVTHDANLLVVYPSITPAKPCYERDFCGPSQARFSVRDPCADVVSASTYLTDPPTAKAVTRRCWNLCRADRYQGRGLLRVVAG
jgi:hypothetical protein